MINILPVGEPDKSTYLQGTGILEDACELLLMKDKEDVLGGVAVTIENSELLLLKLFVEGADLSALTAEQRFMADSLLRAAASYGANQYAYRIISEQKEGADFFRGEGFTLDDSGRMVLPTSAIVKICKES